MMDVKVVDQHKDHIDHIEVPELWDYRVYHQLIPRVKVLAELTS
jgi:hypothetical protein